MVWNDGSSLPTDSIDAAASKDFGSNTDKPRGEKSGDNAADDELPNQPRLYNDEDFLLANEIDIDATLSITDTAGTSYLRPYSRVHLASKLDILAAPTLAIYHLPSRRLIEKNARIKRMQEKERHETWEHWSRGEGAGGIGFKGELRRWV